MLKIKDNVDLKELEKLGFDYNDNYGTYIYTERNNIKFTYIEIKSWNRRIIFRQDIATDFECLCILYDLIKADLVEKVKGK